MRISARWRQQKAALQSLYWPLLLLAALWWVYHPVVNYEDASFDDVYYWKENRAVRRWVGLEEIWTSLEMPGNCTNWPLVFTSYWLERRAWDKWSGGYHVTNVAFHWLASVLALVWLRRLGCDPWAARAATLLFAVHPMSVMSVAWVSERKNVLCGVFFFAALTAHARWRQTDSTISYRSYVMLTLAALLSKSSAVILPIIAIGVEPIVFHQPWSWSMLRRHAPCFVFVALSVIQTMYVERLVLEPPLHLRPLIVPNTFAWCVLSMFYLPAHGLFYPQWQIDWADVQWWWAPILMVLLAAAWWRFRRRLPPLVHVGLMLFTLAFLPTSGVHPFGFLQFAYVSDHFAYLSSLGFLLAAAVSVRRMIASTQVYIGVLLLLAALAGRQAMTQLQLWQDPAHVCGSVDLETANLMQCSGPALWLTFSRDRRDQAIEVIQRLHERFPDRSEPCKWLGRIHHRKQDYQQALHWVEKGLQISPDDSGCQLLLADILHQTGDHDAALQTYEEVLRHNPGKQDVLRNLGMIHAEQHRLDRAIALLEQAIQQDRFDHTARFELASLYRDAGDLHRSRKLLAQCLRLEPDDVKIQRALQLVDRDLSQQRP